MLFLLREMYCGHPHLCVCLCVSVCVLSVCVCLCVCLSAAACLHYRTDPDVTWGSGRGCPLVVHYWADLQSGHGLHCYGNKMRMRNVSKYMLVQTTHEGRHFWRQYPVIASFQRTLTGGPESRDFSLGKFNVTLDCFCGRLIETQFNIMRENPHVRPLDGV